jgi:hypothetical protein
MFRPFMRGDIIRALLLVFCFNCVTANGQEGPTEEPTSFLKFHAWHYLSADQKPILYLGFINGLFAEPRSAKFSTLAFCVEKRITQEQAVQMVDKYLKENPQRWDVPLPIGVVEALTVKDGPCPSLNPFR